MKRYRILLFDADNTLFDFTRAEENAFRRAAGEGGLVFTDELYRLYSAINDGLWKRLERREITLEFLKLERFRLLLTGTGSPEGEETAEPEQVQYPESDGKPIPNLSPEEGDVVRVSDLVEGEEETIDTDELIDKITAMDGHPLDDRE